MENFKNYITLKEGEETNKIAEKVSVLKKAANIQDPEVIKALDDYMKHPGTPGKLQKVEELLKPTWENGEQEKQSFLNWIKNRKGIHTKNKNTGKLEALAQAKDYGTLETKLNKLTNNSNPEIAKKSSEALGIVRKLSAAASLVVQEADGDDDLEARLNELTKEIDSLLTKEGSDTQTKINNANAQKKMQEVYNSLYEKYQPQAKIKDATSFLKYTATLASKPKTLSFNELSVALKNVRNGNALNGVKYNLKDNNFQNSVKFLLGCLVLKYTLKSDIFGGEGIKKIEGVKQDQAVSEAVSSFSSELAIDKSVLDNFKGYNNANSFLSGLEQLFAKANSVQEEQQQKPEEKKDLNNANKSEEKPAETNSSETQNGGDDEAPEIKRDRQELERLENEVNNMSSNERFRFNDTEEELNRKLEDIFGKNSKILQAYIERAQETLKDLPKNNQQEVKEESLNIYSILDEAKLNTWIKNNSILHNIGATSRTLEGERIEGSINSSIRDMKSYQEMFYKKAVKLREIWLRRTNSIAAREKAIKDLNVLRTSFEIKLNQCADHVDKISANNELGNIGKDFKTIGGKVKGAWDKSRFGQTAAFKKEQDEKTISKFDEVWNKFSNTEKKEIAYAITSGNLAVLRFQGSILNTVENGEIQQTNLADRINEIAAKNDFVIEGGINAFLKKLSKSNFYTKNKAEIDKLSDEYVQYIKNYNILKPKLEAILTGRLGERSAQQGNQQNTQQQAQPNAQNAQQQTQPNSQQDQQIRDQIQNAANQPQNNGSNNQSTASASVVAEAFFNRNKSNQQQGDKLSDGQQALIAVCNNINDTANLQKIRTYTGFQGDDKYLKNSILQFKKENFKEIQQLSLLGAQATVTTGAVSPLPQRMFTKAMRRKVESFI